MADMKNKKKHKVIALLLIIIIAISITVVLNEVKSSKKETFTEEEILDRCITAINEGDGKFLTYAKTAYRQDYIDFLEYYYDILDKYDYEEFDAEIKEEIADIIGDGYVDEFEYLKLNFGDEYKITYTIVSEEEGDLEYYSAQMGGEYGIYYDVWNMDMKEHLSDIGATRKEIREGVKLYKRISEDDRRIEDVNIQTVEFCVTGKGKTVSFRETFYYFTVDNELVPCIYVYDEEEESRYACLELTPVFVTRRISQAIDESGLGEIESKEEVERFAKQSEQMINNCIDAINVKNGKWLTYCEECHWWSAIYFIENYNELIKDRERDKAADSKYVAPIVNGYKEEYAYLKENFGNKFKIIYNQQNIEVADVRDITSFGDVYYKSVINVDMEPENYLSNIEGILTEYGVSDYDKMKFEYDYKDAILGQKVFDESRADIAYKLKVEFTVSGILKEVTFEKEIWVVHINGDIIPFEFKDGEEPSFEHIIIDPAYIVDNVKG